MKKQIWITLLALILALGAFCIGASAEDGTFAASVTSNGVTQHYETVQEAFNAAKDGDTVGILGLGQGDRLFYGNQGGCAGGIDRRQVRRREC